MALELQRGILLGTPWYALENAKGAQVGASREVLSSRVVLL